MRVLGLQPLVLPLDLDTLFAMDDGIMNHTGELELVAFGGVAVQDNLAILQVFDCQRFPVDFADRTWPRSSFHSQRWAHTAQYQCLGLPSLHKARPLFPLHTFLALLWLNVATKG